MMNTTPSAGENLHEDVLQALMTTEGALVSRARLKRLPDKLGLNDIATLLFYHRREAAVNEIARFEENMAAINFISWMNNQIKAGSMPIEGRTNRKLCAWFSDELEPIISKDEVRTCLEILDLFPLEDGCLLAHWWPENELQAETVGSNDNSNNQADTENRYGSDNWPLGKRRKKQVIKLLDVIYQLGIKDPLKITECNKEARIRPECEKDTDLFKPTSFKHVWASAREINVVCMIDVEKYI